MKLQNKKIILCTAVALLVCLLCGCNTAPVLFEMIDIYDNTDLTDTEIVLENEYLNLQFDCLTTQFALTDKVNGKIWYSNPPDVENDESAIQAIKEKLMSQVVLTYGQISGTVVEANNYTLSIVNGTYDWEVINNSIKVRYTIGKAERIYIIPHAMPDSRFILFYDQMNNEQQNMLDNYYRKINIERLRPTDDLEELLEKYPELENEIVHELRQELPGHIMEKLEEAFEETGYTYEDFIEDSHASESLQSETPVFNISVIYTLDGPDFVVTVPQEEIEYRHNYPILTLTVLPFFGSASTEEDGFMFVPDASGALIYNNNNKHNQSQYSIGLYGFDTTTSRPSLLSENYAYMPVFGAACESNAYICVVEEGDANCVIEADVSGRMHKFNSVNSKFTVITWDDVDVSKASVTAKAFDRTPLTGVLQQRYIFISSPDYVSMAEAYREYLIKTHPELKPHNETDFPLVINVVGAISRTENTMGVPIEKSYPLTTYKEAIDIMERYVNSGVNGLRFNYIGWFNGGAMHESPDNVKLISSLGGKKGFTSLINAAADNNVDLFFEADFLYISDSGIFDGFVINRDSVRNLSRNNARVYRYCFACFNEWRGRYGRSHSHYLANTDYTIRAIDSFYSDLQKLGGENITFSAIGRSVFSDFNINGTSSRTFTANLHAEKLSQLSSGGAKLMVHGTNMYAVPYADAIIDMPVESNNFAILDASIPFYQIVMHGLVPYTGSPLNLSADYERSILKAVETGSGLQFTFINEPGESLLETNYSRYFASDINRWGDEPLDIYQKINSQLRHTASQFITDHKILGDTVTLTEYEDGTTVIVNYTNEPFVYEGKEIAGMDFEVFR